ncbi:hypothetical protein [Demequina sp. NBRC 110051]|uniref:hypothetical protein n=1 Tax=Demequina sp. NBRC 110051 TaxID=1570340 RepID=UPI000A037947|nr:hypothetical protein [Demequina sp. NBRC 110051]
MTDIDITRALKRPRLLAGAGVLILGLAGCASGDAESASQPTASATAEAHDDHDHEDEGHDEHEDAAATESAAATPRLVATYDGGIVVLDASTLETVADIELTGFHRLNSAGDGRHVGVSTTGGFEILDAGTWSEAHGDHAHYFTAEPALTDLVVEAETPGHLVNHDGYSALFDDGTGHVVVVDSAEWTHMVEEGHLDVVREYTTEAAHHGVAVATSEGNLLVTIGDEDSRSGATVLDENGEVIVSSEDCVGVHGETAFTNASGEEILMTGCEDGALVFHGDHVHKLDGGAEYARSGNLFSAEGSDVVLGDYKTDPEGSLTQVAVIDTAAETITPVDPFDGSGAEYTFRNLARGDNAELLVLGTDGTLRVLDESGALVRTIQVIDAWETPDEWQSPQPTLITLDGMAYVTEPATREIHIVDYVGGEVWKSAEVGVTTNEIVGVTA